MRKSIRIAAMGAALALTATTSSAYAASATANATATVLSALTVTNTAGLRFGTIAVNGADLVTVAANGTVSCGANLVCAGTSGAATYTMTGANATGVKVTLPAAAVTITSGANTMTVDTFTTDWVDGNTLTAGAGAFNVGGTLHVANGQAAGSYTGTYSVSVDYQ